ncbi:MAG: sulfotransferase [Sphingomonadales bacterium]
MTTNIEEQNGKIRIALQEATSLLSQDPKAAEVQAFKILKNFPDFHAAKHILGAAYRYQGKPQKALEVLIPLNKIVSNSSHLLHELGLCYSAIGESKKAIKNFKKALKINPKNSTAWISLGDHFLLIGNVASSRKAFENNLTNSTNHPELIEVSNLLKEHKIHQAEKLARGIVIKYPTDVSAIRMLAEVGLKVGRLEDTKKLLERCLELAPSFHLARHNYAICLFRLQNLEQAMIQIKILLKTDPNNPSYLLLKGSVLVRKGDHKDALDLYESILKNYPDQARPQINYGHTLKAMGRSDDAIRAYRKAITLSPKLGEAYWNLANLKTFRFTDLDIESMQKQVTKNSGDAEDQAHLAFALGKAFEDRKKFTKSFGYYFRGNSIRSIKHVYDPKKNVYDSARQIKTFDKKYFKKTSGSGFNATDPIFIVGLPRAGSTLIEQILASHSKVEGTAELTDIIAATRKLGGKERHKGASKYPEIVSGLLLDQFKKIGEDYIKTTQVQRNGFPYFIDKMPNNFLHIGFIHSILPNAKIIDARRHPMGGCFSGFKQLFAQGQTFTYNLENIGYYYRDYVRVMDHWDEVLPGKVHLIQYEKMVSDTETQIRNLLNYCGLEFEEQCLQFHKTERAIRTPSSEQVRLPVYIEGLAQWQIYELHLAPLKKALGPLLDRYPID